MPRRVTSAGGKDDDGIDARGALDIGGIGAGNEGRQHEQSQALGAWTILPCGRDLLARPWNPVARVAAFMTRVWPQALGDVVATGIGLYWLLW